MGDAIARVVCDRGLLGFGEENTDARHLQKIQASVKHEHDEQYIVKKSHT